MHACGHDVHMAAWMTTARIMAGARDRWAGTLVLIGQPAEETLRGAQWMIDDGLLTRFPRPDFALAIHDDPRYPAGIIGYRAGPMLANSDMVRVTIFGAGGHGARPETTVDPVVIAARTVLALQTIVSREVSPFDAAVITVGSIHAGTRANIIPAEARLELSVRSLTDKVRAHLLSAIERVVKAEAAAGRSPKEPLIERVEGTDALVNDPALTQRVSGALLRALGSERVKEVAPEMASEDFSRFHRAGVPTLMLRVGTVEPTAFEAAEKAGVTLPSLHSPLFAPDRERTLKAAIDGGGAQPARADARPRRIVVRHHRHGRPHPHASARAGCSPCAWTRPSSRSTGSMSADAVKSIPTRPCSQTGRTTGSNLSGTTRRLRSAMSTVFEMIASSMQ